jgi:pilus assembly protein Flp/PilA
MLVAFRILALTPGSWLTARLNIKSERGATAVEYGIMVALIAAVIIAAVVFLGQKTSSTFSCTGSAISTKDGTSC